MIKRRRPLSKSIAHKRKIIRNKVQQKTQRARHLYFYAVNG